MAFPCVTRIQAGQKVDGKAMRCAETTRDELRCTTRIVCDGSASLRSTCCAVKVKPDNILLCDEGDGAPTSSWGSLDQDFPGRQRSSNQSLSSRSRVDLSVLKTSSQHDAISVAVRTSDQSSSLSVSALAVKNAVTALDSATELRIGEVVEEPQALVDKLHPFVDQKLAMLGDLDQAGMVAFGALSKLAPGTFTTCPHLRSRHPAVAPTPVSTIGSVSNTSVPPDAVKHSTVSSTADIADSVASAVQAAEPVMEPGTVNLMAAPYIVESAGVQSTASNSSPHRPFSLSISRPSLRRISSSSSSRDKSAEDGDATIPRSVGRLRLTTGSNNTSESREVHPLKQEMKTPIIRFDDIPTFDGTPETVSAMKKVFSAFEERVRSSLMMARNDGDSSSTEKEANAALLSNIHYVLRGDARDFHDRLKAGEEPWEAVPPPSALLIDAPARLATIRSPSLWTEMRQAFIDHFLPVEGIAQCAAALLTLRLGTGESVHELAARLLGLHSHLKKLTKRHIDKVSYCDAILMGILEKGLPPDLLKVQRSSPACSSFQQCVDRAAYNTGKFKNNAYHAFRLEKADVSLKRPHQFDQSISLRGGSSSASTDDARRFFGKIGSSTSSRDVGQSHSTFDGDGDGVEISLPVTSGAIVSKIDLGKPCDSHETRSASAQMKFADRSRTPVDGRRLKNSGTSPEHSASIPLHSLLPESCQANTPSANRQDDIVGQMVTRKAAANRSESGDVSPHATTRSPEMNEERARSATPCNRTLLPEIKLRGTITRGLSGSGKHGFSAPHVPKKVRFDLRNDTRVLSLEAARSQRLGWMKETGGQAGKVSAAGAIVEEKSRDTPSESRVNGDDGGPKEDLKDFSFFLQDYYSPWPNAGSQSRKEGAMSSDSTELIPLPDAYKCISLSRVKAAGTALLNSSASDPGMGREYRDSREFNGVRFGAGNTSVITKPLKRRKGGETKLPTSNGISRKL